MIQLSKRLQAVACMVHSNRNIVDIGTDHGYIPIFLVTSRKCQKVIAMDINKGPLARAQAHIFEYQLADYIEVRLSDGLKALQEGECKSAIIAGMGGALIIKILTEGKSHLDNMEELVLQPQSDVEMVRRYLLEIGWAIVEEDMLTEDGKFYTMMRAVPSKNVVETMYKMDSMPICFKYGAFLLKEGNEVLKQFLDKEEQQNKKIKDHLLECEKTLQGNGSQSQEQRLYEIEQELATICFAKEWMN